MTFPSSSKNVFVTNDHLIFNTYTKFEYLYIAFSFVVIILFFKFKIRKHISDSDECPRCGFSTRLLGDAVT